MIGLSPKPPALPGVRIQPQAFGKTMIGNHLSSCWEELWAGGRSWD